MFKSSSSVARYLSSTALVALVIALPSRADAAEAEKPAAKSDIQLEEIVVTAQKVKENLQTTPVSVTALTAQAMADRGVSNIREAEHFTPNLLVSPGYSGGENDANFFIRGIGQIDFVATSDPGVGLYIDGVYIGRTTGAALDTANIERLEVLRGPQGTLFGKNTIGGAVNVITKQPSNEASGYAQATVGRFGRTDGQFYANMPVSETLFASLSGSVRHNDGFAKRVLDGVHLGDANDVGGRLALRWLASDKVDVLLSADVTKRRAHIAAHSNVLTVESSASRSYTALTGLDVLDYGPSSDPRTINTTSVRPDDDLDVFGTSATVTWDLGGAELKSITAYRKMDQTSAYDFDGTLLVYNDQEIGMNQKQFSQELQLTGQTAGDKLKWIAGAYYLNEKSFQDTVNKGRTGLLSGFPLPDGRRETTIDLTTNNYALYGQATYNATDRLGLTAGVRWTYEKKHAAIFNERTFDSQFNVVPQTFVGETSWSNVSPKAGVQYQVSDNLMTYGSVTWGFKSGSYNGRPDRAAGFEPYDPEKVTAFEVGVKSELADRRVRLNLASFLTKYKAIQLLTGRLDDVGTLFFPVDNAGDLDIKGVEAELQARPVAGLNLFANVGYADENWTNIYPAPFVTVGESTRLPSMSHWNLAVGFQYEVPVEDYSVAIGGDWSYRSSYYQTTINSTVIKENGYGLLGAHLSVKPEDEAWELSFWGKNLTDSVYYGWGQDLTPIGDSHATVTFGRPREYGVTLRLNF